MIIEDDLTPGERNFLRDPESPGSILVHLMRALEVLGYGETSKLCLIVQMYSHMSDGHKHAFEEISVKHNFPVGSEPICLARIRPKSWEWSRN